jgi:hypothetical protein
MTHAQPFSPSCSLAARQLGQALYYVRMIVRQSRGITDPQELLKRPEYREFLEYTQILYLLLRIPYVGPLVPNDCRPDPEEQSDTAGWWLRQAVSRIESAKEIMLTQPYRGFTCDAIANLCEAMCAAVDELTPVGKFSVPSVWPRSGIYKPRKDD